MAKLPASKVTEGGASEACLTGTRSLFDKRFSDEVCEKCREAVKRKHYEYFPQNFYARLLEDNF